MSSASGAAATPTLAARIAWLAAIVLGAFVVWLAAGPLTTNDLWWHLAHGRAYLAHGLFGASDPCLATATGGAIPHQWLFAVVAYGVEAVAGLHGLRVAHALAVVGIGWLAYAAFRRVGGASAATAVALAIFFVLSWYRLIQLRPELVSIACVLALDRLLFALPLPSWRRVAIAILMVAAWANVHAAFLVGPLLIGAATVGALLEWGVRGGRDAPAASRVARLAAAGVGGLFAALANPRGIEQHLAFWRSNREGEIFRVVDEWARFDPFARTNVAPAVSDLAWGVTNVLLLAFVLVAAWTSLRALRVRDRDAIRSWNPVRLALAAAGCVALVASIRFSWMAVFPLLYLLAVGQDALRRPVPRRVLASTALALAFAFPVWGGFRTAAAVFPTDAGQWLRLTHTEDRFFAEGVRFLSETGIEGALFHPYGMGGFLCHQLGPRVRTFVDGSMNVPAAVSLDYRKVMEHAGSRPGESPVDVLDRHDVDLFFGVGVPAGPLEAGTTQPYTTGLLESVPGWILVSRSFRHAIYLRDDARNRENRERVAAWYAREGVPYSDAHGLVPGPVLDQRGDWAEAWRLAPEGFDAARSAVRERRPGRVVAALETVGLTYALAGAYERAAEAARDSITRRPRAKEPRQRLVYALLHAGEDEAARAAAEALVALDPADARSRAFARLAERAAHAPSATTRNAVLAALPLIGQRRPLRQ